ncbi:hypothetical protein ES708_21631 [subsurface metagenome]
MAIGAYLFINMKTGSGTKIVDDLRKIPEIKQANIVTGMYDIIAYVEAADMKTLGDTVLSKIQKVPGIDRTVTSVCVQE